MTSEFRLRIKENVNRKNKIRKNKSWKKVFSFKINYKRFIRIS